MRIRIPARSSALCSTLPYPCLALCAWFVGCRSDTEDAGGERPDAPANKAPASRATMVEEQLVNIDFKVGRSPVHGGTEGVLGAGRWNVVSMTEPANELFDAGGKAVGVQLVPLRNAAMTVFRSLTDLNELQDTGVGVSSRESEYSMEIRNVSSNGKYDLALYSSVDPKRDSRTRIKVTHAGGETTVVQRAPPTFQLPGTSGADYFVVESVAPVDLGDDARGFRVTISYAGEARAPVAAMVTGMQIKGPRRIDGGAEPR